MHEEGQSVPEQGEKEVEHRSDEIEVGETQEEDDSEAQEVRHIWVCFVIGRNTLVPMNRCISGTPNGRQINHEHCGWRTVTVLPEIKISEVDR